MRNKKLLILASIALAFLSLDAFCGSYPGTCNKGKCEYGYQNGDGLCQGDDDCKLSGAAAAFGGSQQSQQVVQEAQGASKLNDLLAGEQAKK